MENIIISIISLLGTLGGSLGGILVSSKLTNYRIEQLEKKVDRHNDLVERMYSAEQKQAVFSSEISVVNHRLDALEHHGRREGLC